MLSKLPTDIAAKAFGALIPILLALQAIIFATPAKAEDYLQCVPYARELSGVEIYGDAHLWWDKAAGNYERGQRPVKGAVLSLPSYGAMQLGHVAVVTKIIDNRNILISHANWSPINGRRGQIENKVAARDVSAKGDWSQVRIYYAPIDDLGTTAFPVNGFIYPKNVKAPTKKQWASVVQPAKAKAPNKMLLASNLKAELAQSAQLEQTADSGRTDPIGDLLARMGS